MSRNRRKNASYTLEEFTIDEAHAPMPPSPPAPSYKLSVKVTEVVDIDTGARYAPERSPAREIDDLAYGTPDEAPHVPIFVRPDPDRNNITNDADRIPDHAESLIQASFC